MIRLLNYFDARRADRIKGDNRIVLRALRRAPEGFTAYEISRITHIRLARSYAATGRLMGIGMIEDEWRRDPERPELPARRFYLIRKGSVL